MKHRISHPLSLQDARRAAEAALAFYRERHPAYEPTLSWSDQDSGTVSLMVRGHELRLAVRLLDGAIQIEAEVPLIFRAFTGRAIAVIEAEMRKWVEKVEKGEA